MLSTRFIRIPFAWVLLEDIRAVNKRYTNICKGDPSSGQNNLPCQYKSQRKLCYRNQARLDEQKKKPVMTPGGCKQHHSNKIIIKRKMFSCDEVRDYND